MYRQLYSARWKQASAQHISLPRGNTCLSLHTQVRVLIRCVWPGDVVLPERMGPLSPASTTAGETGGKKSYVRGISRTTGSPSPWRSVRQIRPVDSACASAHGAAGGMKLIQKTQSGSKILQLQLHYPAVNTVGCAFEHVVFARHRKSGLLVELHVSVLLGCEPYHCLCTALLLPDPIKGSV